MTLLIEDLLQMQSHTHYLWLMPFMWRLAQLLWQEKSLAMHMSFEISSRSLFRGGYDNWSKNLVLEADAGPQHDTVEVDITKDKKPHTYINNPNNSCSPNTVVQIKLLNDTIRP